ncbi:hypothetical protein [Fangia hongkongensis]|uniref:hypothetical protein n=1 Tax=Fangia hongkongensis TaxID=270495 RepID=UPI000363240B|nr:hypothetical protein [Fangia hongkongensis]MBK2124960.1 hypothetical protein [Fangia hongkongensis]
MTYQKGFSLFEFGLIIVLMAILVVLTLFVFEIVQNRVEKSAGVNLAIENYISIERRQAYAFSNIGDSDISAQAIPLETLQELKKLKDKLKNLYDITIILPNKQNGNNYTKVVSGRYLYSIIKQMLIMPKNLLYGAFERGAYSIKNKSIHIKSCTNEMCKVIIYEPLYYSGRNNAYNQFAVKIV